MIHIVYADTIRLATDTMQIYDHPIHSIDQHPIIRIERIIRFNAFISVLINHIYFFVCCLTAYEVEQIGFAILITRSD